MLNAASSSAHTPAPWYVTEYGDAISSDDAIIALLGDAKEKEANARLIAAAPSLLKALNGMVDAIGMAELFEHDMENCGPESCSLCEARAAIEAAEG